MDVKREGRSWWKKDMWSGKGKGDSLGEEVDDQKREGESYGNEGDVNGRRRRWKRGNGKRE